MGRGLAPGAYFPAVVGSNGKETFMARSTVTSKGQVTIPKSIRESLGIGPGAHLIFKLEAGERLVVVNVDASDIRSGVSPASASASRAAAIA